MFFLQATQGGGGWPMSVFLTPDLKPFVGGTYFPPRDSYGRPGFATLLKKIASKVSFVLRFLVGLDRKKGRAWYLLFVLALKILWTCFFPCNKNAESAVILSSLA